MNKDAFIFNTVIWKVANGFLRETRTASRIEANFNFVKGATDYGRFKIDYTLEHRTRGEGLWMAIVTSGPREIERHKRVRSDKDPVRL